MVKSVLAKEEAQSGENEWIQPSNDNQGDSDNEENAKKKEERKPLTRQSSFEHSIKTGATRIINQTKNKKRMETCLVENDSSEDQIQRFLATDTSDVDEQNWIQPGTTVADDDTTSEAEHSSILHDFKETISETISETLSHLHLPHHTSTPDGAINNKHGLLETAMETMLMEQAGIMGAQAVPASDHVENIKFEEKRNLSVESFKKLLAHPFRRRSNDSNEVKVTKKEPKKEPKKEKFSLFDSAMKTMLNETAHIIEGVGVHPKSLDEGDGVADIKPDTKHDKESASKIEKTQSSNVECSKVSEMVKESSIKDDKKVEKKSTERSYTKFCDNLNMSHVLDAAGSASQSTGEMPVFVLTKCISQENKKQTDEIDTNTHIDSIVDSCVSIDNMKLSPKTIQKSNINQDLNKPLIHSHSGDFINQTNKTKLLAHDPHHKHRSHDEKSIPVNSTSAAATAATGNSKQHARAESYGTKTQSSPTKVPTSSSSYNTASTGTTATSNLSSSKGKDCKDAKETICRRSSDSDLSITPKGNVPFVRFFSFSCKKKEDAKISFFLAFFLAYILNSLCNCLQFFFKFPILFSKEIGILDALQLFFSSFSS